MFERATIKELPNPDSIRYAVVEQCEGCFYVFTKDDGESVCVPYYSPAAAWRRGCPMATNQIVEKVVEKKMNPLKASKKARKGI
jgi:hypothetical protein